MTHVDITPNTFSTLSVHLAGSVDLWRLTVTGLAAYGDRGADGGPGLWRALAYFLKARPQWSVISVDGDAATISRDPNDKPVPPPRAVQAWNYAVSKIGDFFRGRRLVPEDVAEERMSHCWVCPSRVDNRCSRCGCYLDKIPDDAPVDAGHPGKAWRADERCPALIWLKYKPPRTA